MYIQSRQIHDYPPCRDAPLDMRCAGGGMTSSRQATPLAEVEVVIAATKLAQAPVQVQAPELTQEGEGRNID
jgi:hypothetical protein